MPVMRYLAKELQDRGLTEEDASECMRAAALTRSGAVSVVLAAHVISAAVFFALAVLAYQLMTRYPGFLAAGLLLAAFGASWMVAGWVSTQWVVVRAKRRATRT